MKKGAQAVAGLALRSAAATLLLLLAAQGALADGKYYPEHVSAKPPEIPVQRALLVYRNGQERLIIESALKAEGRSFGWVIPVPAVPTEIKAATSGALDTLSNLTQPDITHDRRGDLLFIIWISGWCVIAGLLVILWPQKRVLTPLGLFAIFAFLLASMFLPALGTQGASASDANMVRVIETAAVGSYDVSVLSAKDATALNAWLAANSFAPLPDGDAAVVADYVKNGWVFVTAKLRRDGDGVSIPHPLSISFPSRHPVYPMRLTGRSGGPVALDLYVIADGQALCSRLSRGYCGTFPTRNVQVLWGEATPGRQTGREEIEGYWSTDTLVSVSHPGLSALMWPGCAITKLSARLSPSDMTSDFLLTLAPASAYRPHVYSRQGALETAAVYAIPCWAVAFLLIALILRGRMRSGAARIRLVGRPLAAVTATVLLAGTAFLVFAPKIDVVSRGIRFPGMAPFNLYDQLHEIEADATQGTLIDLAALRDEYASAYASAGTVNSYTGAPVRMNDSPGDYMILEDSRGLVFRAYDWYGRPHDRIIKSKEADSGAEKPQ